MEKTAFSQSKEFFSLHYWVVIQSLELRYKYQTFWNSVFPLVCFSEQTSQPALCYMHIIFDIMLKQTFLNEDVQPNTCWGGHMASILFVWLIFLFSWMVIGVPHSTMVLRPCDPLCLWCSTYQIPFTPHPHVTNSYSSFSSQLRQNFLSDILSDPLLPHTR